MNKLLYESIIKWLENKNNFYSMKDMNDHIFSTNKAIPIQLFLGVMNKYIHAPQIISINDKKEVNQKKSKNKKSYFFDYSMESMFEFITFAQIKSIINSCKEDGIKNIKPHIIQLCNIINYAQSKLKSSSLYFETFKFRHFNTNVDLSNITISEKFDYSGFVYNLKQFVIENKELTTTIFFPFETNVNIFEKNEHVFEINHYKFNKKQKISNTNLLNVNELYKETLNELNPNYSYYAFFNPFSITEELYFELIECIKEPQITSFLNLLFENLNEIQHKTISLQQQKIVGMLEVTKKNGKLMKYKEIVDLKLNSLKKQGVENILYYTLIEIKKRIKYQKNFKIHKIREIYSDEECKMIGKGLEDLLQELIIDNLNYQSQKVSKEEEYYNEVKDSFFNNLIHYVKEGNKRKFKKSLFMIIDQIFLRNQRRKDIKKLSPYYSNLYDKYKLKNFEDYFHPFIKYRDLTPSNVR